MKINSDTADVLNEDIIRHRNVVEGETPVSLDMESAQFSQQHKRKSRTDNIWLGGRGSEKRSGLERKLPRS
jgi:hypothetical protein